MKKILYSIALILPSGSTFAQGKFVEITNLTILGSTYMHILIVVFIITALLVLLASLALLKSYKVIATELANPTPFIKPPAIPVIAYDEFAAVEKSKPGIWPKLLGLRPIEEEKDLIIADHNYDGIHELDNPIPAWFMWLFYATIGFAVVYLVYFHVLPYGKMQEEEYAIEMKLAKENQVALLAKSPNKIDENSVKESTELSVLTGGKAVYTTSCLACHGDKGQGIVGPNLTDNYTLHGNDVSSIFKTIKYGIPEKGMISWDKLLSAKQISDVSNYIISLEGTNPPNPKASQGVKNQ